MFSIHAVFAKNVGGNSHTHTDQPVRYIYTLFVKHALFFRKEYLFKCKNYYGVCCSVLLEIRTHWSSTETRIVR